MININEEDLDIPSIDMGPKSDIDFELLVRAQDWPVNKFEKLALFEVLFFYILYLIKRIKRLLWLIRKIKTVKMTELYSDYLR